MEIKITIETPELTEAITALVAEIAQMETQATPPATKRKSRAKVKVEDVLPAADPSADIGVGEEDTVTPQPNEKVRELSLEEVRAKLVGLSKEGKALQVRKLLASFNATKLTEVSVERYRELMKKAEEL